MGRLSSTECTYPPTYHHGITKMCFKNFHFCAAKCEKLQKQFVYPFLVKQPWTHTPLAPNAQTG